MHHSGYQGRQPRLENFVRGWRPRQSSVDMYLSGLYLLQISIDMHHSGWRGRQPRTNTDMHHSGWRGRQPRTKPPQLSKQFENTHCKLFPTVRE